MQSPTASDPSFKAFLEKLQEQNSRGFATQLVQLKAEREIAGEDGDKREDQLDQTNENLKDLKDETTNVGDSLREGLHDVSDDIIEAQDQLDVANNSLSEIATAVIGAKESIEVEMLTALEGIKEAVTGIKLDIDFSELKTAIENVGYDVGKDIDNGHLVATIGAIGANTTKLQDEQLKEISLVRKLTEGSVEYDKEAAQYRNTSGRDVESKVSGKTSKSGGFIDFETARDTLSGQGERVKKENKVRLITGVTTTRSGIKPGDAAAEALGANLGSLGPADPVSVDPVTKPVSVDPVSVDPVSVDPVSPKVAPEKNTSITRARRERGSVTGNVRPKEDDEEEKSKYQGLFKEIESGFKFFMTDGLSEKPGHGIFQTPSKEVEKKERETKVSSPRQENPEADNVVSTGEIQADVTKSDLELSKQMLETTKAQLIELKAIRAALAPSTPKELTEQKSAPSSTNEKESDGGGSLIGDLASGAMDLMGGGKKAAGKVAGKAAGIGSKLAKFATSNTGKVLGSVAAVGLGAYTAYEGYTAAEDSKQAKMNEVQAKVDSGAIKPEEAAAQRKEIGNTATIEKSGAVGEGTGMAAGAIAGASLGATIGSVVPGVGTAIGGLAGGAIGAFAGSKAGKFVGEKVGSSINAVKGFFGSDEVGDKTKEAVTGTAPTTDIKFSEAEFAKADPDTYKKFADFKDKRTTEIASDLAKKFGRDKPNPADMQVAQSSAKVEAIEKFKKEIEASGASKSEAKVEKSSGKTADIDSKTVSGSATGTLPEEKSVLSKAADTVKSVGSSVAGFFGFGDKKKPDEAADPKTNSVAQGAATVAGTKSESYTKIAGERVVPDQPLSDKQMAVIEMSKGMGNKYSPEVEAQYAKQKESTVVPTSSSPSSGSTVAKTSTENTDMEREAGNKGGSNNTVVSNNVSSNNTTKFVPMKANPRPEYTGSSLDRYTNRITVY